MPVGPGRATTDARQQRVLGLQARYDVEPAHSTQVTRLTQVLFDRAHPLHRLGPHERELLTYAALLHDIGFAVSQSAHHKHALALIQSADMPEFDPEEVAVIALVARYHRKALPKLKHAPFAALAKQTRQAVCRLASLLRIADGLDRTHRSVIADIQVRIEPRRVVLSLHATGDPEWEVWGARRKSDLFTKTFKRDVVFRTVDVS